MKREEGYYWVVCEGEKTVAEYVYFGTEGGWYATGVEEMLDDSDFSDINETRITE